MNNNFKQQLQSYTFRMKLNRPKVEEKKPIIL